MQHKVVFKSGAELPIIDEVYEALAIKLSSGPGVAQFQVFTDQYANTVCIINVQEIEYVI